MKVQLSSIFNTSSLLATEAGKEIAELITTFADFVKQVVPVMQKGITFEDNINCDAKVVELSADLEQVVRTADGKVVTDVMVGRVLSTTNLLVGFLWWLDESNELKVKAKFDPTPTSPIEVRLLIFYQ